MAIVLCLHPFSPLNWPSGFELTLLHPCLIIIKKDLINITERNAPPGEPLLLIFF